MTNYLMENGYVLDKITHTECIKGDIKTIRLLGNRDVPFLILYKNESSVHMDISTLFDIGKADGDAFCSLLI